MRLTKPNDINSYNSEYIYNTVTKLTIVNQSTTTNYERLKSTDSNAAKIY